MKHSIRFIQFNYYLTGKGKSIMLLRGMTVREYPYTDKNAHNITMLTLDKKTWANKFYPEMIQVSRIYPNSL